MRILLLLLLSLLVFSTSVVAQSTREVSVLLSATVAGDPSPRITLNWLHEPNATNYLVARKLRMETDWLTVAKVSTI